MQELSAAAREHFVHPRHVGVLNSDAPDVAAALVGEPVSGAILQLHLRVGAEGTITAVRFKAYGCAWTVACGSRLAEWLAGRTLAEAGHFRHHELVEKLEAPPAKLHCAVLAETALKAALRAYAARQAPANVTQTDF
jgi:NifU-like protein involved in Fe-S cluster formation